MSEQPLNCGCPLCLRRRRVRAELIGLFIAVVIIAACIVLDLILSGCTHLPDPGEPTSAAFDASTPPQYPILSSGLLYPTPDKKSWYITTNRAAHEPTAKAAIDPYGNQVYLLSSDVIDAEFDAKTDAETKHLESAK